MADDEKILDWMKSVAPALKRATSRTGYEALKPSWSGFYREAHPKGIKPAVDVYLPGQGRNHPSVILVHGGGFVVGSRQMSSMSYLASELCKQGVACASIDYRLIFRGGRLDESVDDVQTAVAWWRSMASEYSLNEDKISLLGCSAGAALVMLSASHVGELWRVIGVYGVYDFTNLPGRPSRLPARLLLGSDDPEIWAARSPNQAANFAAPLLLLHGTADTLVVKRHSEELAARRESAGLPVELCLYPDEPHGFLQDGPLRPAVLQALDDILRFLKI
jgi:acetyl esterase/lipase